MRTIFITDDLSTALYVAESGVDSVMVDLEILGKFARQGHLNTLISSHQPSSISNISRSFKASNISCEVLVRTNPLNTNSESEIDDCIKRGADRLMLPMFSSPSDVESFMRYVDGRVPVTLLLETPAAYARIDDILNLPFDFSVHVGLNDLHLGMNLSFMFELISCGFVQNIASKCRDQSISFGFGGVAPLSSPNLIPPADILSCHVAFGSESVILSRDWRPLLSSQSFAAELSALHNYVEHPLPYCHQAFSDKVKRIAGCY